MTQVTAQVKHSPGASQRPKCFAMCYATVKSKAYTKGTTHLGFIAPGGIFIIVAGARGNELAYNSANIYAVFEEIKGSVTIRFNSQ